MTRLTFFGTFVSMATSLFAQRAERTIDKRNSSEAGEFAISFAAKSSDEGFEHAFIIWYYSDAKGNRTVRRAAGFYPITDSGTKGYELIINGVPGRVFDDSRLLASQELTIRVNKDVFDRAVAVEASYKDGKTYRLAFNDCTTFVKSVAETIAGLKVPNRATHLYPSSFVRALFDQN